MHIKQGFNKNNRHQVHGSLVFFNFILYVSFKYITNVESIQILLVTMNNTIFLSCIQCIYGVDINCTIMIHVHKETTFEI